MTTPDVAQARGYDEIMAEAREAFADEDIPRAAELLDAAQALRPYSLYILRNRILTRILTDRMDEAIALAQDVADRGLVLETPPNAAFDRMRADPAFAPVERKMVENAAPRGVPKIIFEHAAHDLLPEAINKGRGAYYIGSVRTGAVFELRDGALREIARANGGVFDLEARNGRILAAANNQLAYEDRSGEPGAELIEVDVRTGSETGREKLGGGAALVGDIEISRTGIIYASDSLTPRIFLVPPGDTGAERREIIDGRFANLQGLALDEKRGLLFVADYLAGLFVVDLTTLAVEEIANPTDAHLGGIDGLYLHKGHLVGIQNGTSPQRIVQIRLDRAGRSAQSLEVLQQALPEWNEPTHGVIDGGDFVYIATSNWPAYGDDGAVVSGARLEPLRLMSVRLK
jgi:hypothetical protein